MTQPSRSPAVEPRRSGPPTYPSEDDVAETLLHFRIRSLLHLLLQAWFEDRGERALLLTDQFVYWVEGDERTNLAPDLLVLPGEDPERSVTSWKVWEEEAAPGFAMEVVSEDIDKDYVEAPVKYAELGVTELVIYDPLVPKHGRTRRIRWQVYRWVDGRFEKVVETNADRVESVALGCWLVEVGEKPGRRVRLATGADGQLLVPTPEEAARAAVQEAQAAAQSAQAAAQSAQAAAQSAQAEAERERRRVAELEAEVQRLKAR
jgi:Putative restriction endonuclease